MSVMKIFVNGVLLLGLILTLRLPSFAEVEWPDCATALSSCNNACDQKIIYDLYEDALPVQPADFNEKCKAACSEGFQFCQKQDSELSCNTFAYHCTGACPWEITVTDSTGGHSVSTKETNSFTQCRRSCHRGQRDCNVKRQQIPFRNRSADFNACVEAQFSCYDTCSTCLDHEIDQCAEACDQGAAACIADPNPSKCGVYNKVCAGYCPPYTEETDVGYEWGEPEDISYCEDACRTAERFCQKILE